MADIKINKETISIDAPDNMPLLWAIRDIIGYTGTKYGCGKGLCGACTVWLNGNPIRSCITPIAAAKNAEITTIEGLSESGDHPVQQAWQEHSVPQCGYCQSGQIMSAAALINNKDSVTDDDIDQAMSGNICRCGTYTRIKSAIHRAAEIKGGSK